VVVGADGLGFAKQKKRLVVQDGPVRPRRSPKTTSRFKPIPASTARLSEKHASARGQKSTTCFNRARFAGWCQRHALRPGWPGRLNKIGDGCILAGQVGTAGHLTIGNGAVITAKSGVPNDVPPAGLYSGYPAVENRQWLKTHAALNRLPDLQRRVRELEEQIAEIQRRAKLF